METSQLGRRLLELKEQLDQEKEQRSELQGELKSINRQLEKDFGVKSLAEAEKRIKKEKEQLENLRTSIQERLIEAEEMMNAGDN